MRRAVAAVRKGFPTIALTAQARATRTDGCRRRSPFLSSPTAHALALFLMSAAAKLDVVVDTNAAETPLHDALLAQLGAHVVRRERLDLGDVALVAGGQRLLVERKTWNDWAASVVDGRYKEQKARFLGSEGAAEGCHLVYLIEGGLVGFDGKTHGISNKALNAAVLKTQMRDGIAVLRTRDGAHSAASVGYLAEQLAAGGLDPASARRVAAGSAKKRKRENLDEPAALYRAMLAVIPGMSDDKADAVATRYRSLRALRHASAADLAATKCGGPHAKKARALGPALAARIVGLYAE